MLKNLVKDIDMPISKVRVLVDALGLPLMERADGVEFTSRSSLRELLTELAGAPT